jgi:photosystem II stability/assembly factor-like uncharacterized protein
MDEDPAPGDRRRRAVPLIAAAVVTMVVAGILYLHPLSLQLPAQNGTTSAARVMTGPYTATYDFFTPYLGWALVLDYGSFSTQLQTTFTIFRTADGTAHWVPQFTGVAAGSRTYLHFFNAREGFAYAGFAYRTVDGGAHWTALVIVGGPYVTFASPTLGWALDLARGGQGLLRTTDGGQSWSPIADLPNDVALQPIGSDEQPMFSSTGVGWLGAGLLPTPAAYTTVDFGQTWRKVEVPGGAQGISQYLTSVLLTPDDRALVFVLDQNGTLVEVLESTDSSSVWLVLHLPWADVLPGDLTFVDGRHWWLMSLGRLFTTEDAGSTWVGVTVAGSPVGWITQAGHAIDTQHGWWSILAQGSSTISGLLMTSDGGVHWHMVNAPQPSQ